MHDWPDSECLKILERLTAAMGPDSRILIDEVVLPNTNAPWQATMQDVSMGILFGGKERTQQQWEALAAQAQLNLVQIHNYNFSSCNSIIVLGKAA
jgi:demethylsterigmatocystin 6-O-methyltransferase